MNDINSVKISKIQIVVGDKKKTFMLPKPIMIPNPEELMGNVRFQTLCSIFDALNFDHTASYVHKNGKNPPDSFFGYAIPFNVRDENYWAMNNSDRAKTLITKLAEYYGWETIVEDINKEQDNGGEETQNQ